MKESYKKNLNNFDMFIILNYTFGDFDAEGKLTYILLLNKSMLNFTN